MIAVILPCSFAYFLQQTEDPVEKICTKITDNQQEMSSILDRFKLAIPIIMKYQADFPLSVAYIRDGRNYLRILYDSENCKNFLNRLEIEFQKDLEHNEQTLDFRTFVMEFATGIFPDDL